MRPKQWAHSTAVREQHLYTCAVLCAVQRTAAACLTSTRYGVGNMGQACVVHIRCLQGQGTALVQHVFLEVHVHAQRAVRGNRWQRCSSNTRTRALAICCERHQLCLVRATLQLCSQRLAERELRVPPRSARPRLRCHLCCSSTTPASAERRCAHAPSGAALPPPPPPPLLQQHKPARAERRCAHTPLGELCSTHAVHQLIHVRSQDW